MDAMTNTVVTIPTLVTDRLVLRAPRLADRDALADFLTSPRSATIGGPFPASDAFRRLSTLVGHWHLRGFGRWIVADPASDDALGIVGLYYPEGWPEPEIAWTVFGAAEGRGIAQEAALAARRHAYGTLGWTTAMSAVDPANTRSVALARRMGCVPDGSFDTDDHGRLHIWRHPSPEEAA